MAKIKNIIIFGVIAIALILVYIFFIKPSPDTANLVSSTSSATTPDTNVVSQNSAVAQDLLSLLLSVKSIRLDDSIFSDKAFTSLHDSSILLTSPGNEGRPNPFAPIGFDALPVSQIPPPSTTPEVSTPSATVPIAPSVPVVPKTTTKKL